MFHQSPHVRVTAEHGTATVWLGFPGEPAHALDLARLRELDGALAAVAARPAVGVVVVRGEGQRGFCGGVAARALASLTTEADAASFSRFGQRVLDRLAGLEAATVAFIEGPCLGAGLELALACDYRLAVAAVDAPLGFPDAPAGLGPCFGGSVRLPRVVGRGRARRMLVNGDALSAREARRIGLVDHACSERRGRIDLRSLLDGLEPRPRKARRGSAVDAEGFAAERRTFARDLFSGPARHALAARLRAGEPPPAHSRPRNPIPPRPDVVAFAHDDDALHRLAAEWAVRGTRVLVLGTTAGVVGRIVECRERGFLTPLEAERARGHVAVASSHADFREAGLAFAPDARAARNLAMVLRPRAVIAVCDPTDDPTDGMSFARRAVGIRLPDARSAGLVPFAATDGDALAALTAWLKPLGIAVAVRAGLAPEASGPPIGAERRHSVADAETAAA